MTRLLTSLRELWATTRAIYAEQQVSRQHAQRIRKP